MSNDTHFDDRLLWIGGIPAIIAFIVTVGAWLFGDTPEYDSIWLMATMLLMIVGGAFIAPLMIVMPILAPIAWYQQMRLGYTLPRSLSALVVIGGLVSAGVLSWLISNWMLTTTGHIVMGILFWIGIPSTLIGIVTERRRMKDLKSYKYNQPIPPLPR